MASTDDPTVVRRLLRSFVIDFFNRHDVGACADIMHDDYELTVGTLVLSGRDDVYAPAVASQFEQFPHLAMTVHAVLTSGSHGALVFSEHGASGGAGGRVASWTGIALYRCDGDRLASCITVEDYAARRRQLRSGVSDPVPPASAAPWDVVDPDEDADALDVVRSWVMSGADARPGDDDVIRDDEQVAGTEPFSAETATTEITHLFGAGPTVAFHAIHTTDDDRRLHSIGVVDVVDGSVERGRVVRDRASLSR